MDFYIVDAKTGKNRGPVVMDPWDDISAEEVYTETHETTPPSKYVVHIPTNCCYELEPDGKTVIICGAHLTPKIDGETFWRYSDVYFEKVVVPVDPVEAAKRIWEEKQNAK